jgi:hypothetical protein
MITKMTKMKTRRRLPEGQGIPGQQNTSRATQQSTGLLAQSPAPPSRTITGLEPDMVKCPACDHWEFEDDFDRQRVHLLANHPNLVRDRLVEHHRWDGWEQD